MTKLEQDVMNLVREFETRANSFEFSQQPKTNAEFQSNGKHLAYTHVAKRIREVMKWNIQEENQPSKR